MKSNVKISVIIPVYNSGKYIVKCLDSIKNQSINDYEIVIINDGSTDNSGEIIQNYIKNNKDINIDYYEITNHGVSYARNIGIDNSKSDYIMFVDSDDYLPNDAIEKMIEGIKDNSFDIVCGNYSVVDINGKEISRTRNNCEEIDDDGLLIKCLEDEEVCFSSCAKIYRREFIGQLRFEEGKKCNEDSFFVFQCATKKPKVKIIEDVIYKYVKNMESSSNSYFSEKYLDILYFAKKKTEIISALFSEYVQYNNDILLRAYINLLINLSKTKDKKYREITKESIAFIKNNSKNYQAKTKTENIIIKVVKYNMYYVFQFLYMIKFYIDNHKVMNK